MLLLEFGRGETCILKTGDVDSGVRFIWLKPGYVESSKVGWLIYELVNGMQFSREEAIFSLAEELYNKYMQERRPVIWRDCCQKNFNAGTKYCSGCGHTLEKFVFDLEEFEDWLRALVGSDCNDYGGGDDGHWYPYCVPQHILEAPKSQHHFLSHYGDLAILYALHLNPRVDWQGTFNPHGGCWNQEYLEHNWAILMETGKWSLGQ